MKVEPTFLGLCQSTTFYLMLHCNFFMHAYNIETAGGTMLVLILILLFALNDKIDVSKKYYTLIISCNIHILWT